MRVGSCVRDPEEVAVDLPLLVRWTRLDPLPLPEEVILSLEEVVRE